MKLKNHKSAQCDVFIQEDGTINFVSYTTLVIVAVPASDNVLAGEDIYVPAGESIDEDSYYISCSGTYSQTTSKQITWFLREYFAGITLDNIKQIAGEDAVLVAHRKEA